jgi:hypothetical protein
MALNPDSLNAETYSKKFWAFNWTRYISAYPANLIISPLGYFCILHDVSVVLANAIRCVGSWIIAGWKNGTASGPWWAALTWHFRIRSVGSSIQSRGRNGKYEFKVIYCSEDILREREGNDLFCDRESWSNQLLGASHGHWHFIQWRLSARKSCQCPMIFKCHAEDMIRVSYKDSYW